MREEEKDELQMMEKKSTVDKKSKKKNEIAVAEELTEYGGVTDKDCHSHHVYFSDSDGAEMVRIKSKKGDKKKKAEVSDNAERTVNDSNKYSLNMNFKNGISEVNAETSKDDSKYMKKKGKRASNIYGVSDEEKRKVAYDERVTEDKNHINGEGGEKAKNVKVRKNKQVGKDKDHTNVIVTNKVEYVKVRKKIVNDKDVGKNKDNSNVKTRDEAKDVKKRRKVVNDEEVGKEKDGAGGEGGKKAEDVNKRKNGNYTESCLTQTLSTDPIHGKRKKMEDTKVTSDKGCITLNSKNKGKRKKEVPGSEMEKDGKKKSKKVKKKELEAIEPISKSELEKDGRKKSKNVKKKGMEALEPILNEILHICEQANDKDVAEVNVHNGESNTKKKKVNVDQSTVFPPKKKSKSVSFSGQVEVFPLSNNVEVDEENIEDNMVHGKRFTPEEDEMLKEAVSNYIKVHGLGEQGLDMVLHCGSHPEIRGCWKEIGAALPWRPHFSIYYRGHILFERGEKRKWDPDEYDALRRHHEIHGSDWKPLADVLGKHRIHVKDAWRRIKVSNKKKGRWSQDEYQALFELVNMDLRMKAFEEKKTQYGMLRDNIAWESISERLSTRTGYFCCMKWYQQLVSPMLAKGIWANSDDYCLLSALLKLDASCVDDVDWDNLLENRPGNVCLKRWHEMTKHIGDHREKSFAEQVEVLSNRYCPNLPPPNHGDGHTKTT